MTFEHPLEWGSDLLVAILEAKQAVFKFAQGCEVIRRQDLALHDGEVNFDLVQPTGVDRRVDRDQGGPLSAEAIHRLLPAMARPVVHNPKDPAGGTLRLLAHDLGDQTVKRLDTGFLLAAPEDFGAPYVPGRQISPSSFPLILVLHLLRALRDRRQGSVPSPTGLDAGLLVGTQNGVARRQRSAFPQPLVEVENSSGLFDAGRMARENPTAEAPGTERVATEPAPQCAAADFGHDPFRQHFAANLRQGKA